MRTRSKPAAKKKTTDYTTIGAPEARTLPPSDTNPPKVVILPRNASSEARIITLQNPATAKPHRYFYCPDLGLYEFTNIAPRRETPRSWLLSQDSATTQDASEHSQTGVSQPLGEDGPDTSISRGYLMKEPDMLLATPLDAVFLLLPILSPPSTSNGNKQMFLAFDEYLDKFTATSKHEKHLIARMNLGKLLKARATSICDFVDAGDEKMYRISHEKLAQELLSKARRMCCSGLPASMEEHFVNSALRAPVSNVLDATPQDQANSDASQNVRTDIPSQVQIEASTDSQTSAGSVSGSSRNGDSQSTTGTGATSLSEIPQPLNQAVASEDARQLLRLRTALNFVLSSYVPQHLRKIVQTTMSESKLVEFSPLDEHLKHLETLRRKAQALRSLSDNITRKRGADDDDEAAEARAEKKRKKEEEEKKEKAETRAMKQLKKVDTKGMKKLSAFFTKAPAR